MGKLRAGLVVAAVSWLPTLAMTTPTVDCEMRRITLPLTTYQGKVTCAASFMYGRYTVNPKTPKDLLHSKHLKAQLQAKKVQSKLTYPEYVIQDYFEKVKAGKWDTALEHFQPGLSKSRARKRYEKRPGHKKFLQSLTEVVFLNKAALGPYIRLAYYLHEEVPESSAKKGRALPGNSYLTKADGGAFLITEELDKPNLFEEVLSYYTAQAIIMRNAMPLNPDTGHMQSIEVSVGDLGHGSDGRRELVVKPATGSKQSAPSAASSDKRFLLLLSCEPANVTIAAGKTVPGLSQELRFFESAVTAYEFEQEPEDIASFWAGESKKRVTRDIQQLVDLGKWAKWRPSPFGKKLRVISVLRTSFGSIVYYANNMSDKVRSVAILKESPGHYALSFVNELPDRRRQILRRDTFEDAVRELYLAKNH